MDFGQDSQNMKQSQNLVEIAMGSLMISGLNLHLNCPKKHAFSNSILLQNDRTTVFQNQIACPTLQQMENQKQTKWKIKNKQKTSKAQAFKKQTTRRHLKCFTCTELFPSPSNLFQISTRSLILGQCYDNGSMPT